MELCRAPAQGHIFPSQKQKTHCHWSVSPPLKGWLARGNHQDLRQPSSASAGWWRRRADQAVHANIPEEGAPGASPTPALGATQGADCGCQFFCCFKLSCHKHSPTTLILKGSLSLPFLPFHRFKNTEADSPNVWNNWILHSNSSVKYSLIKLA